MTEAGGVPRYFWWGAASTALMVVGALGPWGKILSISVSGTDGTNDGWLVVAAAVVGFLFILGQRRSRWFGLGTLLAGALGTAVTLYDRNALADGSDEVGGFASLVTIGWGLNLAVLASMSLAFYAIVSLQNAEVSVTNTEAGPTPAEPSAGT
jgi:hypothetical protein